MEIELKSFLNGMTCPFSGEWRFKKYRLIPHHEGEMLYEKFPLPHGSLIDVVTSYDEKVGGYVVLKTFEIEGLRANTLMEFLYLL